MNNTPIFARGEVVSDETGTPRIEFVEDVFPGDKLLSSTVVMLPDRTHPVNEVVPDFLKNAAAERGHFIWP